MNNDSELMNWASKLVTIMILTGGKPGSNHNGEKFWWSIHQFWTISFFRIFKIFTKESLESLKRAFLLSRKCSSLFSETIWIFEIAEIILFDN